MTDMRFTLLQQWLTDCGIAYTSVMPLAGDASFRRYYRVHTTNEHFIAMDAPPQRESCAPFVAIANDLHTIGLNTPAVFHQDLSQGFLLLTDFGDVSLFDKVQSDSADNWYPRCLNALRVVQHHQQLPNVSLKDYNNGLYSFYEESSWFLTWFLQQYANSTLSHQDLAKLEREIHAVAATMLEQPQVVTHRDYHSRNIMITNEGDLGFLDFQDAVIGPITYDVVSLVRGCYIDFAPHQVTQWCHTHYHALKADNLLGDCSFEQFMRWLDWTGLQRHLKCAGLFVRLNLRDSKPQYQQYIPRLLNYIASVSANYAELSLMSTLSKDYRDIYANLAAPA